MNLQSSRYRKLNEILTNLKMKNDKNTDLKHQNVQFRGHLKIQEYRDITLNTKLGNIRT